MAVGDVITAISAINTTMTFNPAAGVEVMLSEALISNSAAVGFGIDNGAGQAYIVPTIGSPSLLNIKLFIKSTMTIYFNPVAGYCSHYSRIQIK